MAYQTIVGSVTVQYGANSGTYPISDFGDAAVTVGDVRAYLGDVFNIPNNAQCRVSNPGKDISNKQVSPTYEIQDGDILEFVMQAGNKG